MFGPMLTLVMACGSSDEPKASPEPAVQLVQPALVDPKWQRARCNDGTPFGMAVRRTSSDVWVIKVSGGFFCDDDKTLCSGRKPRLTTAPSEGAIRQVGLFSTDPAENPDFHDANQVVAAYCSSDLWLGAQAVRQETTGAAEGWYFSGRLNLQAGLEVLSEHQGLIDGASKILVVGDSAGGMGVVSNVPMLQRLFPKAVRSGDLKLIADGAWVPRQPDLSATPVANRWGAMHEGCVAEQTGRGLDPRNCVFGDVWYPHVRASGIPILVQQSALDSTQAQIYAFKGAGSAAWRKKTRASLSQVEWVFSGGFGYHTVAFDTKFGAGKPGRSFQEVLGRFWRGDPPEQVFFRYPD
jgi:hypothetical protein